MGDVVVITGAGGMGLGCARRLGPGRTLILADFDPAKLKEATASLTDEGYDVMAQELDVADVASVGRLAAAVRAAGSLRVLVHTAGLSPSMASAARIFEVDMLGMDHVLTGLLPLAVDGTVAVCIASMAGYFAALPGSLEHSLAKAPTDELMSLVGDVASMDSGRAYCIAKKVNQLRVAQAAASWGAQGARIVSISPGTISTPMGRMELDQGHGATMQQQLDMSPIHRIGTADDIASAVEWLTGPGASFITGIDLRIDGGITAVVLGMGLFVNPEAG